VVCTDYPDEPLIAKLRENMDKNAPEVEVKGYIWGQSISPLIPPGETGFDVLILCDLVFNHSEHASLLKTCQEALNQDGVVYCVFTHHRPKYVDRDLNFLNLCEQAGFELTRHESHRLGPMFEVDFGDVEVRSMVHMVSMTRSKE
jgi:nicotinamide N-methyltransferase